MNTSQSKDHSTLQALLEQKRAVVGVIGLGYVGLPLAMACVAAGFEALGFDIDASKIQALNGGNSYIDSVPPALLASNTASGRFGASCDFSGLERCDVIIICVPTPLSLNREPDLTFVEKTACTIASFLRSGQLVVLESTTYPGTTEEIMKPLLEASGLRSGIDFFLGFSPEREDPGNLEYGTRKIPKIFSGDGESATLIMELFYGAVFDKVIPVSSPAVAEAVKITENIFRSVNIALVNELKIIYDAMGIDIWEVIEAASTKPFGYMPFFPGPGLGGHCIPIDPFYLTWKCREYGLSTRFIELAGEINISMPRFVLNKLEVALDRFLKKSLSCSNVLIMGLAYKKNVSDVRESPAFALMDLLSSRGTEFSYHDPFVNIIPRTREHLQFSGLTSVDITPALLQSCDAVVVVTDHDSVDYRLIAENSKLIIDTRNVFDRRGIRSSVIVKA